MSTVPSGAAFGGRCGKRAEPEDDDRGGGQTAESGIEGEGHEGSFRQVETCAG